MKNSPEELVRDVLGILGNLVPARGIYFANDYLRNGETHLGIEAAIDTMVDDDVAIGADVAAAVMARLRLFFSEEHLVAISGNLDYLVRLGDDSRAGVS